MAHRGADARRAAGIHQQPGSGYRVELADSLLIDTQAPVTYFSPATLHRSALHVVHDAPDMRMADASSVRAAGEAALTARPVEDTDEDAEAAA
jgi:hypothetical protein